MIEQLLEGREISRVCFDFAVVLVMSDATELRLETPFRLASVDATPLDLDPDRLQGAGEAVIGLLRQRIETAMIDGSGSLSLQFTNGQRLQCEPDEQFEAWTLTSAIGDRIVCLPGGGVAQWRAASPP